MTFEEAFKKVELMASGKKCSLLVEKTKSNIIDSLEISIFIEGFGWIIDCPSYPKAFAQMRKKLEKEI